MEDSILDALNVPPAKRRGFSNRATEDYATFKDWLYPKMPKQISARDLRQKPEEWLRKRYRLVYAASMGNHSVARFYCAWTATRYEEEVSAHPEFAEAIREESLNIADRAKYLLHEGLGLLTCNETEPVTNSSALSILARLEGELRERGEVEAESQRQKKASGRRPVCVEGLTRPAAKADAEPGPGPGRPDSPAV